MSRRHILHGSPCPGRRGTGCSDFSTARVTPPRGTFGAELYSVLCDRVGAQALREDVTGASFQAVCNPDANGNYADQGRPVAAPAAHGDDDAGGPAGQPRRPAAAPRPRRRARGGARPRSDRARRRLRHHPARHHHPRAPARPGRVPRSRRRRRRRERPALAAEGVLGAPRAHRRSLQRRHDPLRDPRPGRRDERGEGRSRPAGRPGPRRRAAGIPTPAARGRRRTSRARLPAPRRDVARASSACCSRTLPRPGARRSPSRSSCSTTSCARPARRPRCRLLTSTPDPVLGGRLVLGRPRSFLEAIRLVALTENAAFSTGNPSTW